ncbi:MAG: hypothetical protein V1760_02040 [Candidatus Peregrinibacteria bacterium]
MKIFASALRITGAKLLIFAVSLGILIAVPAFIHQQWVTGPLVNAALFISTVLVGPMEAVLLGLMPSAVALSTGLLPLPLAPMVPFIMMGNAVLVALFHYFYKWNIAVSVVVAAFLKFLFLASIVRFLMGRLLDGPLVSKLAVMMSWPQFFTAVIGGAVAVLFLKGIQRL